MSADPSGSAAPERYKLVAIAFHWIIAGLVLVNIWFGWHMSGLKGLAQFELFQMHKSVGITVLVLTAGRLGWRLLHRTPALPESVSPAQRRIASWVHGLLYGLTVVLPLTGWIVVSASAYNLPTVLYGLVPWPHISPIHSLSDANRKIVEHAFSGGHAWLAWSLAVLAALHVGAALEHQFWSRDGVLMRMVPSWRRQRFEGATNT